METHQIMKSVTATYPGFHGLPRGVKQMLLFSENYFFGEARPTGPRPARSAVAMPETELPPANTPALREISGTAIDALATSRIQFSRPVEPIA